MVQFHVLSFEGPDAYARAGGLASRIEGLSQALARTGHPTHLWFVGDPDAPGHESHSGVALHRWCQWVSRHHPGGVYDGEEGKVADYGASLPPFLLQTLMRHLLDGGQAVVLAEEWQTVGAVLHLDYLLRQSGLRERVSIFWNANNTFGFERIDWHRLSRAACITAVSRYMKHTLQARGVEPVVIPNGLPPDAYEQPERAAVASLRREVGTRLLLAKMARFDPDKRWLGAVRTVAELKEAGWRPLLVARGGSEPYGGEVLGAARSAGLRVADRDDRGEEPRSFLEALRGLEDVDIVNLRTRVGPTSRRTLFRAADAVLANSSHEPFGLVGLETMAVGGIACTGCSGEDYAIPGRNALVLQSDDPREFLWLYKRLRDSPPERKAMRLAARVTARHYAWSEVIGRNLLPRVEMSYAGDRMLAPRPRQEPTQRSDGRADVARMAQVA